MDVICLIKTVLLKNKLYDFSLMVLKILVLIYGFLLYIIPGEGCLLLNLNHEAILGSTKKRLGAFHGS